MKWWKIVVFILLWESSVHIAADFLKKMKIIQEIRRIYPRWGQTRIKPDPKIKKLTEWFSRGALPSRDRLTPRSGDMAIRREYRTLTDRERHAFHDCLTKMKQTPAVDGGYANHSEYETFVLHHTFDFSPEAHESPSFLIFHRMFIYLFERLMRSHPGCHDVGLPYWDPTLDGFLPDPSHTLIFSHPDFLGNGNGRVTTGFLGGWGEVVPPYCLKAGSHLTRDLCKDPDQVLTDEIINKFLRCGRYEDCVTPKNRDFEDFHGLIHGCLGGHMIDLSCAPNDPVFFLYHCFIDHIFQEYLDRRYPDDGDEVQNPIDDYPKIVEKPYHVGTEPLKPFNNYRIIDGLSRNFSRFYVRYEPRPHRCNGDADCGGGRSRALWCDVYTKRCKARLAMGGDCSGLPDSSCYPDCPVNQVAVCSTKTVTCQCETRICAVDSDCADEIGGNERLCDSKSLKCQAKLYVGQNCGHLPDKFCTGGCVRSYETPRCIHGVCVCEIKVIGCENSRECPEGLWCLRGRCSKKISVGESCEEAGVEMCGGFESGTECPFGYGSVCSKEKICRCIVRKQKDEVTAKRSKVDKSTETNDTKDFQYCLNDSDCPNEEFLCVGKKSKLERKGKQCRRIICLDDDACFKLGLKRTICRGGVCMRRPTRS